jgi:probable HAF family extracellular repeat protein
MTVYTYTTFDDPLAFAGTTFAFGINDMGQIVGYYDNNSGHHGFLLSGGTYTTLDDPSADAGNTLAHAVSAIGQVAGQYTNASGTHGFFLSGGNYRTLDDPTPTTTATVANGIDVSGQIGLIVGYFQSSSGIHGFVLSNSTYTTLDDPSASNNTVATSVNGKGQIVGHYEDAGGTVHGFLLTGGVLMGAVFSGGTYTTIDIPWLPVALSSKASTMRAKSSGLTTLATAPIPSSTAAASSRISTIP